MVTQTKIIIKCFKKYNFTQLLKCKTICVKIKNSNIGSIAALRKSDVYKLRYSERDKVYFGGTGSKLESRLADHSHGEGSRTTNSLYARHFIDENHKFISRI